MGPKKVTMKIKVIKEESRYDECVSDKSRFLKQKPD